MAFWLDYSVYVALTTRTSGLVPLAQVVSTIFSCSVGWYSDLLEFDEINNVLFVLVTILVVL